MIEMGIPKYTEVILPRWYYVPRCDTDLTEIETAMLHLLLILNRFNDRHQDYGEPK
jgi:hypothetical protein